MKRLTPRPKKKPVAPPKPPIPVNGWLKLWLKIINKEMDDFHVEEFKKED
jgi:hypothetical protein